MSGVFITFEGTEGSGKSTHIALLADRLRGQGCRICVLREPGGTPVGEEIRHALKHSASSQAMTPETELLLVNAGRAQLVREVIRPALARDEVVLCDRFHDSTTAYQGYGRQLDLDQVRAMIDFAVGDTRPVLTLLLMVPLAESEARRQLRQAEAATPRDRLEEAGRDFFERVEAGYRAIAAAEPQRVRVVDSTQPVQVVQARVWAWVEPLVAAGAVSRSGAATRR